jgi:hypothetical protein
MLVCLVEELLALRNDYIIMLAYMFLSAARLLAFTEFLDVIYFFRKWNQGLFFQKVEPRNLLCCMTTSRSAMHGSSAGGSGCSGMGWRCRGSMSKSIVGRCTGELLFLL